MLHICRGLTRSRRTDDWQAGIYRQICQKSGECIIHPDVHDCICATDVPLGIQSSRLWLIKRQILCVYTSPSEGDNSAHTVLKEQQKKKKNSEWGVHLHNTELTGVLEPEQSEEEAAAVKQQLKKQLMDSVRCVISRKSEQEQWGPPAKKMLANTSPGCNLHSVLIYPSHPKEMSKHTHPKKKNKKRSLVEKEINRSCWICLEPFEYTRRF